MESKTFERSISPEMYMAQRHENVVRLLGYCREEQLHALVYEYMPGGNLHDALMDEKRRRAFTLDKRLRILW